jgi:hypothetical protein
MKTVGIGANMTKPKSSIDHPLAEIEKNSIGFSESGEPVLGVGVLE